MFCAIQAERALRRLEGVATVRVVQSERKAYVELKPRTPFDPKAFRKAIEGAGQRVETFELVLCATIAEDDGRYFLQPADSAQRFAVSGDGVAQKLHGLAGRQVCVRGKLVATDPRLALEIAELATLSPH
jgi:hypothetical protein